MSTRATIMLEDKHEKLYFYKHSDGYPQGTTPLLKEFCDFVKDGKIRDNPSQSGGWLILLGAEEYGKSLKALRNSEKSPMGWKVGSIEPAKQINSDIEYIYYIDLTKKIATGYEYSGVEGKEVFRYDFNS